MQAVKNILKKTLGVDPSSKVTPLKNLTHIGSKYHGYFVPTSLLNSSSVCYCIGAGEDVSLDTELVTKYDAKVFIFDPAPEGRNHFNKLAEAVNKGQTLSIGHENSKYTYKINAEQLAKISYNEVGVWDQDTMIKFYKPDIEDYASHSIKLFHETGNFIEVPVDRLTNLMRKLKHTSVDLLKMEIEGAEYTVIETIVQDKPDIKMILVEFDEVYHAKGLSYLYRIKKSSDSLLKAGYKLVHSTPYFKRLYVRDDVYSKLKAKGE